MIAENTVALVGAFLERDLDEVEFRALLVTGDAERLGLSILGNASRSVLFKVRDSGKTRETCHLSSEIELVVAAAASAIQELRVAKATTL